MVSSINSNMSFSQSTAKTRLEPQLSQLERLRKKRGITSGLKDGTIDQPTSGRWGTKSYGLIKGLLWVS